MILERAPHIPDAVSGGQDTVGIRCPSHPVAIALLQAFKNGKGGVAAPSANKFGHVSPTTAQHVRDEFGADPRLAMVLDGGQSQVGIESTIVHMSRLATHGPVLLRPVVIGTVLAFFFKSSWDLASEFRPTWRTSMGTAALLVATLLFLNSSVVKQFVYFAF